MIKIANEQNFEIRQGETWSLGMTILGSDGITPQDLTGATITGAVREKPGADKVAVMDCAIADATAGAIAISMADEVTAKIPAATSYDKSKTYYYDIKMERKDGVGIYLLTGTIIIWGGVQIG